MTKVYSRPARQPDLFATAKTSSKEANASQKGALRSETNAAAAQAGAETAAARAVATMASAAKDCSLTMEQVGAAIAAATARFAAQGAAAAQAQTGAKSKYDLALATAGTANAALTAAIAAQAVAGNRATAAKKREDAATVHEAEVVAMMAETGKDQALAKLERKGAEAAAFNAAASEVGARASEVAADAAAARAGEKASAAAASAASAKEEREALVAASTEFTASVAAGRAEAEAFRVARLKGDEVFDIHAKEAESVALVATLWGQLGAARARAADRGKRREASVLELEAMAFGDVVLAEVKAKLEKLVSPISVKAESRFRASEETPNDAAPFTPSKAATSRSVATPIPAGSPTSGKCNAESVILSGF